MMKTTMKLGSMDDLSMTRSSSSHLNLKSFGAVNGHLHHSIIAHPVTENKTVNQAFFKWIQPV